MSNKGNGILYYYRCFQNSSDIYSGFSCILLSSGSDLVLQWELKAICDTDVYLIWEQWRLSGV